MDSTETLIIGSTAASLAALITAARLSHYIPRKRASSTKKELLVEQADVAHLYDPPLSESELRTVCGNHRLSVHSKEFFLPVLFSIVVTEYGVVWYELSPNLLNELLSLLCLTLNVLLLPSIYIFSKLPCNCGTVLLLSAKDRMRNLKHTLHLANPSIKRDLIGLALTLLVVAAILGCFISLLMVFCSYANAAHLSKGLRFAYCLGIPNTVLLVLGVAACLKRPTDRFLTRAQRERLVSLEDDSVEGLTELIAFYSRIGNFKKADEYANKLVEIS